VQNSIEKTTAPGSCCHFERGSGAHENPVAQGFADGNIAIIGHESEKEIFCPKQEEEKKDLGSTSPIGDGSGIPERIGHVFRESIGDGAQVEEGEVDEEDVHGCVQAVVACYSGDDEAIAQQGSQVDAQEEPEEQELQLLGVCKCQEEEIRHRAAIGRLVRLCTGACPTRKNTVTS